MATSRQGDLFGKDEQDDLFEDQPTPVYRADPDAVRDDLYKILAEARAARKNAVGANARVALSHHVFRK